MCDKSELPFLCLEGSFSFLSLNQLPMLIFVLSVLCTPSRGSSDVKVFSITSSTISLAFFVTVFIYDDKFAFPKCPWLPIGSH